MNVSIAQLREQAQQTIPGKISFQLLFWAFNKPNYGDWADLVEEAVMFELTEICQRKNDFHDVDEDTLTATIVIALNNLGFKASGKVVNGNADLAIVYDVYLWLGEAKIARDTNTIFGGYLQLTQRYATGIKEQCRCGMLLFCQEQSAKEVLAGWRAALIVEVPDSNPRDQSSLLAFRSVDTAVSSGLELDIIHIAFPLKHEPQDATRTLSKAAQVASKAAKRSAKKAN